jgi:hypothetical protein
MNTDMISRVPLNFYDIKQGDAIRSVGGKDWYPISPDQDGVHVLVLGIYLRYTDLVDGYEIRSVGEKDWRPCSKEAVQL